MKFKKPRRNVALTINKQIARMRTSNPNVQRYMRVEKGLLEGLRKGKFTGKNAFLGC